MGTIKEAHRCQGISERIKNTSLLRQYSFFTKLFVWLIVLLLPLGLVEHPGDGFNYHGKNRKPNRRSLDNKMEDIPLHAICRTIDSAKTIMMVY